MNTARTDFSLKAFPGLHIFEFFMRSLREQTFKDFEVVIADVLYETRSNYFDLHPENFSITHVPIKPNIWTPKNLIAISTTKNTALLYARGEIIIFTDDCSQFQPRQLEIIDQLVHQGKCITNNYNIYLDGSLMSADVRRPGAVKSTYGNVALCLSDYIRLNGYNESYDGTQGLEDCEFGIRMYNSGMEIELIDYPVLYEVQGTRPHNLDHLTTRCPRLLEKLALTERRHIWRANTEPYTEEQFKFLKQCDAVFDEEHQCPHAHFKCRGRRFRPNSHSEYWYLYKHPSLIFNLEEQRKDIQATLKWLERICLDETP